MSREFGNNEPNDKPKRKFLEGTLVVGIGTVVMFGALRAAEDKPVGEPVSVTVESGDTKSGIVNRVCTEQIGEDRYNFGASLDQSFVANEDNNKILDSRMIQPGDVAVVICMKPGGIEGIFDFGG